MDHIRFGLRLCPAAVCGCKLWGQEQPEKKRSQKGRPFVYALSTAIYCTSRTYFGGVGLAADKGLEFLGIYTGPILAFTIGMPIIRRIVELAKTEKLTSVADFIAARYGKNSTVAMIVAIIALVGAIPYIALQLKAVSSSVATMVDPGDYGIGSGNLYFLDLPLLVTIVMAGFAVMFGTGIPTPPNIRTGLFWRFRWNRSSSSWPCAPSALRSVRPLRRPLAFVGTCVGQ